MSLNIICEIKRCPARSSRDLLRALLSDSDVYYFSDNMLHLDTIVCISLVDIDNFVRFMIVSIKLLLKNEILSFSYNYSCELCDQSANVVVVRAIV